MYPCVGAGLEISHGLPIDLFQNLPLQIFCFIEIILVGFESRFFSIIRSGAAISRY